MNRENLRRLAAHLINGHLFQTHFRFDTFRGSGHLDCGTAGCAIGECGQLFNDPELEHLLQLYDAETKVTVLNRTAGMIREWAKTKFGIDDPTFGYLFMPVDYRRMEISWLADNATAKDVGRLIEHFLETGIYLKRSAIELSRILADKLADINNDPYKV